MFMQHALLPNKPSQTCSPSWAYTPRHPKANSSFESCCLCLLSAGVPNVPPTPNHTEQVVKARASHMPGKHYTNKATFTAPPKMQIYTKNKNQRLGSEFFIPLNIPILTSLPTPPPSTLALHLPTFGEAATVVPWKPWMHRLPACLSQVD